MPLAFYMDVHVPAAVTDGLRMRGIDILTSQEDGTREVDDESLLARATDLNRILFTQDDDLLAIANRWQSTGRPFSGVVYAHQQGPGIGRVVDDLTLIAECMTPGELSSNVFWLPLA